MSDFDLSIRRSFKPRALQLLVAVDDLRQIGKVAAFLNVSQPAVSKAITDMERALNLRLFDRTSKGVVPTIYGECLIRHARTILGDLSQARDELQGLMSGGSGVLRVGTLPTAALELLPRALAELKARHPNMTIIVREGTNETLLPHIWLGELDLIVGRLPDRRMAGAVHERMLRSAGVSLVAGPHHPLVGKRRIGWSDVAAYPWVFPPLNTVLRAPLERAFERNGVPMPQNRIETLSVHVIRSYLQHSDAIAVISEDVSRYYEALGLIAILPLELPPLVGEIGVIWSRHRPLSPGAEELIGCLERAVRPRARPRTAQRSRSSSQSQM